MRNRTLRFGQVGASVILCGGILVLLFQPQVKGQPAKGGAAAAAGAGLPQGTTGDFVKLGIKFEGANSCSNADCHGAAEAQEAGATTKTEFTQWSGGDAHKNAYATLEDEKSTAIAEKLKIEATDARCTSCHAAQVPENLQGSDFDIAEGVSCASCHGPSERWNGPHQEAGWAEGQRKALKTHDALLKKWGLYDTKSVLARANMCTSCHLAIDADMVKAGHPQPVFELDYFSKSDKNDGIYVSQHWRDPKVPFYNVSLWSTGQAVALRDAMLQLAQRAGAKAPDAKGVTEAYNQAMAHYNAFKPVVATKAVAGDTKAWDVAVTKMAAALKGKQMAAVATGAKAVAAEANKIAPTVGTAKFDRAKALAILKALLADTSTAKTVGSRGMEQQAYAIYALWTSVTPGEAGAKTTTMIIDNLFAAEDGTPPTPAKFTAGLAAIAKTVK
jgi:hypothetical protein